MNKWYTVTEKFDTASEGWEFYLKASGLTHLKEVVGLDQALCPRLVTTSDFTDQDWKFSVQQDYFCDYFTDLNHLLTRLPLETKFNILAVIHQPRTNVNRLLEDERFIFCGYDLIEESGGMSALTNCGGFPLAFANQELNSLGLITDFTRAIAIQKNLQINYPEESHAFCDIWAIWRMKEAV